MMKTYVPREIGPWCAIYDETEVPEGKRFGVMLSTGPQDIALSGGTRKRGVLIAWRFRRQHRIIGHSVSQKVW